VKVPVKFYEGCYGDENWLMSVQIFRSIFFVTDLL